MRIAERCLHIRNIGAVVERVGRSHSARNGWTGYPELFRDPVSGKRSLEGAGSIITDRPEEGGILVMRVSGGRQIIYQQGLAIRMQGMFRTLPPFP